MVEPGIASDVIEESPSWTSSYSTTVQGSSPRLGSQPILENDHESIPVVTQEEGPESATTDQLVEELTSQVVSSPEVGGQATVLCLSFRLIGYLGARYG